MPSCVPEPQHHRIHMPPHELRSTPLVIKPKGHGSSKGGGSHVHPKHGLANHNIDRSSNELLSLFLVELNGHEDQNTTYTYIYMYIHMLPGSLHNVLNIDGSSNGIYMAASISLGSFSWCPYHTRPTISGLDLEALPQKYLR